MPETATDLADALARGAARLGVPLDGGQVGLLVDYLGLLVRWNRRYNLTAVRDPHVMVHRHLLDSLAVVPFLQGRSVLDVGTGAGLPGVVLAVQQPAREFHLLDSNGRKARFLFQVKTALGLDNMTIHQARAEDFSPARGFDVIVSRAFASLQDMAAASCHLLQPGGRFLAMKGTYPATELESVVNAYRLVGVHRLSVPDVDGERHLVEMVPLDNRSAG